MITDDITVFITLLVGNLQIKKHLFLLSVKAISIFSVITTISIFAVITNQRLFLKRHTLEIFNAKSSLYPENLIVSFKMVTIIH